MSLLSCHFPTVLDDLIQYLQTVTSTKDRSNATLDVTVDRVFEVIKSGSDITPWLPKAVTAVKMVFSLPHWHRKMMAASAAVHICKYLARTPTGESVARESGLFESLSIGLGDEKREVRDMAAQALAQLTPILSPALVAVLATTEGSWHRVEGSSLFVGYSLQCVTEASAAHTLLEASKPLLLCAEHGSFGAYARLQAARGLGRAVRAGWSEPAVASGAVAAAWQLVGDADIRVRREVCPVLGNNASALSQLDSGCQKRVLEQVSVLGDLEQTWEARHGAAMLLSAVGISGYSPIEQAIKDGLLASLDAPLLTVRAAGPGTIHAAVVPGLVGILVRNLAFSELVSVIQRALSHHDPAIQDSGIAAVLSVAPSPENGGVGAGVPSAQLHLLARDLVPLTFHPSMPIKILASRALQLVGELVHSEYEDTLRHFIAKSTVVNTDLRDAVFQAIGWILTASGHQSETPGVISDQVLLDTMAAIVVGSSNTDGKNSDFARMAATEALGALCLATKQGTSSASASTRERILLKVADVLGSLQWDMSVDTHKVAGRAVAGLLGSLPEHLLSVPAVLDAAAKMLVCALHHSNDEIAAVNRAATPAVGILARKLSAEHFSLFLMRIAAAEPHLRIPDEAFTHSPLLAAIADERIKCEDIVNDWTDLRPAASRAVFLALALRRRLMASGDVTTGVDVETAWQAVLASVFNQIGCDEMLPVGLSYALGSFIQMLELGSPTLSEAAWAALAAITSKLADMDVFQTLEDAGNNPILYSSWLDGMLPELREASSAFEPLEPSYRWGWMLAEHARDALRAHAIDGGVYSDALSQWTSVTESSSLSPSSSELNLCMEFEDEDSFFTVTGELARIGGRAITPALGRNATLGDHSHKTVSELTEITFPEALQKCIDTKDHDTTMAIAVLAPDACYVDTPAVCQVVANLLGEDELELESKAYLLERCCLLSAYLPRRVISTSRNDGFVPGQSD
eukprot:gnl/Dysnectes_brevis/2739_a3328_1431.p1 GENE.gnl/Dysnectes_brevis/2739_a3328_1431~~gnl/Dysnectes_brevis/2739_a3328_1431.p1  ORF type:complete len:974 (+),score=286.72 gnl/Dysnectes_brevis/2739_a3328_1431:52-2973(+)